MLVILCVFKAAKIQGRKEKRSNMMLKVKQLSSKMSKLRCVFPVVSKLLFPALIYSIGQTWDCLQNVQSTGSKLTVALTI